MNKTLWIQTFLYSLALIAALISYDDNIKPAKVSIVSDVHAETSKKVVSWETKKIETPSEKKSSDCDANCKKKILVKIGLQKPLASQIVDSCKKFARDPVHCIKYASSVSWAESTGGQRCHKFGCFWIKSGGIAYDSLADGTNDWVRRYNKYWYKATSVSDFYPARWNVSKFRYCTSETSSNSSIGCPNGLKASSSLFNKISF